MKTFTSWMLTMRVAFFAFHHALLCADSSQPWIDDLRKHGLLNAEHIARRPGLEHVVTADSAAGEVIDAPCFGHGKTSHVEGVLAQVARQRRGRVISLREAP